MKPKTNSERFEFAVDMIRKCWKEHRAQESPTPFLVDALNVLRFGGYSVEEALQFIEALDVE